MPQKIRFETTECGRCGGSGRYSWNALHGDRCYGCGGTGVVLTKAGAAAKLAYWAVARPEVPVTEVKVGDLVRVRTLGSEITRVVVSIDDDDLNPGQNRVTLRLAKTQTPDKIDTGWGTFWNATIKRAATVESKAAAREAVKGMKGWEIIED